MSPQKEKRTPSPGDFKVVNGEGIKDVTKIEIEGYVKDLKSETTSIDAAIGALSAKLHQLKLQRTAIIKDAADYNKLIKKMH